MLEEVVVSGGTAGEWRSRVGGFGRLGGGVGG